MKALLRSSPPAGYRFSGLWPDVWVSGPGPGVGSGPGVPGEGMSAHM